MEGGVAGAGAVRAGGGRAGGVCWECGGGAVRFLKH